MTPRAQSAAFGTLSTNGAGVTETGGAPFDKPVEGVILARKTYDILTRARAQGAIPANCFEKIIFRIHA